MDLLTAVFLGIVQGLTEFLPISSSGHLVIFQHLFGMTEPALFFDISVHFGTLVAVVIFFRAEIKSILVSLSGFVGQLLKKKARLSDGWDDPDIRLAFLIIIGSVPTAVIGLVLQKFADRIFASLVLAGAMLIITGCLLWFTRRIKTEGKAISGFSTKHALAVGFTQGLAVLPGISRSGSTIAVAMFMGLEKETAGRYSFLLSIPAILGAQILGVRDLAGTASSEIVPTLAGTLAAGIVGYLSLKLLLFILKKGQLHFFAPYCWIAGIITFAIA